MKIITDDVFLSQRSIEVDPRGKIRRSLGWFNFKIPVTRMIKKLIATAEANKDLCMALSAVQVGYLARVFVVRMGDQWLPVINPEIVSRSKEISKRKEWCISRPGRGFIKPRRNKWIQIKYVAPDKSGGFVVITDRIEGPAAGILLHQIDHLNGRLI
jgi:peptide deformylase